jgi:hypothetical protein
MEGVALARWTECSQFLWNLHLPIDDFAVASSSLKASPLIRLVSVILSGVKFRSSHLIPIRGLTLGAYRRFLIRVSRNPFVAAP